MTRCVTGRAVTANIAQHHTTASEGIEGYSESGETLAIKLASAFAVAFVMRVDPAGRVTKTLATIGRFEAFAAVCANNVKDFYV